MGNPHFIPDLARARKIDRDDVVSVLGSGKNPLLQAFRQFGSARQHILHQRYGRSRLGLCCRVLGRGSIQWRIASQLIGADPKVIGDRPHLGVGRVLDSLGPLGLSIREIVG